MEGVRGRVWEEKKEAAAGQARWFWRRRQRRKEATGRRRVDHNSHHNAAAAQPLLLLPDTLLDLSSPPRLPACPACSLETARLMASALGGGLEGAEAGLAGVGAALPPQYVEFKEQIRLEMLGIKQKMAELRGLHGRASLSRFDDGNEEVQVEVLTQQVTRMFRKCEARLQQFGTEPSASAADEKVKRNVQVCDVGLGLGGWLAAGLAGPRWGQEGGGLGSLSVDGMAWVQPAACTAG